MGVILCQVEQVTCSLESEPTMIKPNMLVESQILAHAFTQHPGYSYFQSHPEKARGGGRKVREAVKHTLMQTTSFLKGPQGNLRTNLRTRQPLNQHQVTRPKEGIYPPWEDGQESLL